MMRRVAIKVFFLLAIFAVLSIGVAVAMGGAGGTMDACVDIGNNTCSCMCTAASGFGKLIDVNKPPGNTCASLNGGGCVIPPDVIPVP